MLVVQMLLQNEFVGISRESSVIVRRSTLGLLRAFFLLSLFSIYVMGIPRPVPFPTTHSASTLHLSKKAVGSASN